MTELPISLDAPQALFGYPTGAGKILLRAPLLLYRLGLGWTLPPTVLVLTTTGRRSGQPRPVPLEVRRHGSKRYVISAWGTRADWYQNARAAPLVRVQQGRHNFAVRAVPLEDRDELWRVVRLFRKGNPFIDRLLRGTAGLAADATPYDLFRARDRLAGLRLDPASPEDVSEANVAAPPPVRADLAWLWAVLAGALLALIMLGRRKA